MLIRGFEPSLGRKYRIMEFPLRLLPDGPTQRTQSKGFFSCSVPVENRTSGQTIVQSQKLATECGSKGLISDERPNDGSKVAKRSFKSQAHRSLP